MPLLGPLYDLPWLAIVFAAVAVAGVARLARAVLPSDPLAPPIAAALALIAPPLRETGPGVLAAAGIVWAIGEAVAHAREPSARHRIAAIASTAITTVAAPWLGLGLALALALGMRRVLALAPALLAVALIVAFRVLPAPDLGAFVAASGRASVVLGAGLLGTAFGVATSLPRVGWLALAIALAVAHAIAIDHDPTPAIALLAAGCAIVPGAIARVAEKRHRTLVTLLAAAPLIGLALVAAL